MSSDEQRQAGAEPSDAPSAEGEAELAERDASTDAPRDEGALGVDDEPEVEAPIDDPLAPPKALFDTVPEGSVRRARLAAEAAAAAALGESPDTETAEPATGPGDAPATGEPSSADAAPEVVATPAPESQSGSRLPRPSYAFLAIVTAVSLGADLGTKLWAKFHFEADGAAQQVVLIDQLFSKVNLHFIYAKNPAGAWGLALGLPEVVRRPFFLVVSVAAIVFIISLYRKLGPKQRALRWGLPLVLGGALGNLVDRIVYGKVIDFIDVFFTRAAPERDWHWPTFNVADIAIVVGVLLMAIDMFTSRPKKKSKPVMDAQAAREDGVSPGAPAGS